MYNVQFLLREKKQVLIPLTKINGTPSDPRTKI